MPISATSPVGTFCRSSNTKGRSAFSSRHVRLSSIRHGAFSTPNPRRKHLPLQVPESSRRFQAAVHQGIASTVPQPHLVRNKQRTPEPVSENAIYLLYAPNIAYKRNRSRRRHVLVFFAADTNYESVMGYTAPGYLPRVRMPALAIRNRGKGSLRPVCSRAWLGCSERYTCCGGCGESAR